MILSLSETNDSLGIQEKGCDMPKDNKVIVRTFIDIINRQDWAQFDELVAESFVRHSSTYGQAGIRTRDQLKEYLKRKFQSFPDAVKTISFMVAKGDKIAVHSHCRATQKGPLGPFPALGQSLSADFISIYRVAGERIVEAWVEWDALNGLIQLGHMRPPESAREAGVAS